MNVALESMFLRIFAFAALTTPLCLAVDQSPESLLPVALKQLYNSKFNDSRSTLSAYSAQKPDDPLAYSLRAASYLFSDLDRTGMMKSDFLSKDRNVESGKAVEITKEDRARFADSVRQARELSTSALEQNANDRNALLAMCIVTGVQRDSLALVDHKLRESYEYIKESQAYASRLLKVDPTAHDAYMTKGFTEYLVASVPFFLRWFMKIDDISGSKQQGLSDLQIAATSGHYLKPFAQMMLAMFYQREKQEDKTTRLLTELTREYPENRVFRDELGRLEGSNRTVDK